MCVAVNHMPLEPVSDWMPLNCCLKVINKFVSVGCAPLDRAESDATGMGLGTSVQADGLPVLVFGLCPALLQALDSMAWSIVAWHGGCLVVLFCFSSRRGKACSRMVV